MGVTAERAAAAATLVVVVVVLMVQPVAAAVYKVGDAAGWTIVGGVDYKQWAATKTFEPGDVIVFNYNAQFHNVMRVTHAMYKSCNVSKPLETHTSGNDSITIKSRGHHFFLCGVPGHCQAGQKLDINVLRLSSPAAAPSTPSALASPSVPLARTPPAPAPSVASPRFGADFDLHLLITALLFAFSLAALA